MPSTRAASGRASPAPPARATADVLRALAHGDSSVRCCRDASDRLGDRLATAAAPPPFADSWGRPAAAGVRRWPATAPVGHDHLGALGSRRDVTHARRVAAWSHGAYRLSVRSISAAGRGVASFMITNAVPAGESESDCSLLDLRVSLDGLTGMRLVAEWDGQGMIATQSHAFAFADFPAMGFAWPRHGSAIQAAHQQRDRLLLHGGHRRHRGDGRRGRPPTPAAAWDVAPLMSR